MCLILAILLCWRHRKYKPKMVVVFQPFPHVVVCTRRGCWHGTNKSGKWRIVKMDSDALSRWLHIKN